MSKTCNHTLGHYSHNHYDALETIFVDMHSDESDLMKVKEETVYLFCPYCGHNLANIIDHQINLIQQQKKQYELEKKEKQRLAQIAFDDKVSKTSIDTGLNLLPDGSFIVFFEKNPKYDYKKYGVILGGEKSHILRNCVHVTQNRSDFQLKVEKVLKMPTLQELDHLMLSNGYVNKSNKELTWSNHSYVKDLGNNSSVHIFFGSDGIVYINKYQDDNTTYDQKWLFDFGEFLGVSFQLEVLS